MDASLGVSGKRSVNYDHLLLCTLALRVMSCHLYHPCHVNRLYCCHMSVTCLSHDSCMQIVQKLLNYILPPPFLTPSPPTSPSPLPPHSHISPHFPASVLGTPPSAALLESSPSVLDRQGHTQCHHKSLHWSTRHNLASEGHVTCHMWGERVSM